MGEGSRPTSVQRVVWLILFCIVLHLASVDAVRAQFRFDSYTTDNGLPQNGVRAITQTPDGYLWFTTFDGLVRYDGTRFAVFDKNNSPGITSSRFFNLATDADGTLYAAVENGGLTVLKDGAFRTYTTADGLPSNSIARLRTDVHDELMVEAPQGNVYFRAGTFAPVTESAFPNGGLYYVGRQTGVWTYGTDGVIQTTADGRRFEYPIKLNYFNQNFAGITFLEDGRGDVWFADMSGVYRARDGHYTLMTVADGVPAETMLRPWVEDNEGGIWFGSGYFGYTKRVGLVRYFEGKFAVFGEAAGLSNTSVGQVFKDSEGTIWVATDGGIAHLRREIVSSFSVKDGLAYREVYPMLQAKSGEIYVGTVQGLSKYGEGKFTDVVIRNNGNFVSISALGEDANGGIWVADSVGLNKLEGDRLRKIGAVPQAAIWCIFEDSSGMLWLGSDKGVFGLRDEQVVVRLTRENGLPGDDVKVIKQDRSGALWFGTYSGIAMLPDGSRPGSGIRTYTVADGLASDRVRAMHEDTDGTLWFGTYDGGLSRFKDGRFFSYTVENGLFNNGVFAILEDAAGNFWISCNRGVYRVAKTELNDVADGRASKIDSVAYGKSDGMLSTECNGGRQPAAVAAADGRFWFPTQDGVIAIKPADVSRNPIAPPVHIESVLVERNVVDTANGVELAADDDNLQIRYSGISFIKPDQMRFRYRFEGLSDKWTDVGSIRDLYFPSLPAGNYTLHVIAANADGVWNESGAALAIRVITPVWRRPWFIAVAAVLLLGIGVLVARWRINELERQRKVQEDFSRKLLESQESERQRIAAELHDSIGQSLLIIKNRAYLALDGLDDPETVKEQLVGLSGSATSAIEECREISYNLRPFQIERFGLTRTLTAIFQRIGEVTDAQVAVTADSIDGLFSTEAEINIFRIVQECANNIIKHSAARNAELTITRTDGRVTVVLRDDGCGFDTAQPNMNGGARSGFGMIGIAERIRMLGGTYQIDSAIGAGTSIKFVVPISKDA
jgi:signal transduction histidine kinase/ligand-binding sensor domain-containing protein